MWFKLLVSVKSWSVVRSVMLTARWKSVWWQQTVQGWVGAAAITHPLPILTVLPWSLPWMIGFCLTCACTHPSVCSSLCVCRERHSFLTLTCWELFMIIRKAAQVNDTFHRYSWMDWHLHACITVHLSSLLTGSVRFLRVKKRISAPLFFRTVEMPQRWICCNWSSVEHLWSLSLKNRQNPFILSPAGEKYESSTKASRYFYQGIVHVWVLCPHETSDLFFCSFASLWSGFSSLVPLVPLFHYFFLPSCFFHSALVSSIPRFHGNHKPIVWNTLGLLHPVSCFPEKGIISFHVGL